MPPSEHSPRGDAPFSSRRISRRNLLRTAAAGTTGLFLVPLLAACGGGSEAPAATAPPEGAAGSPTTGATGSPTTAPAAGSPTTAGDQTLTIALAADPRALDPQRVLDNSAGFVMAAIYDSIVKYKPESTETEPGLAERWEISDDGMTYTFTLRSGVTFHDGSAFNADAWVSELDRILNESNPNYIFKDPGLQSFAGDTFGLVTSYTATDASTVEVVQSSAFAPFLTNLAMVWSGVASQKALMDGVDLMQNPVGTGPFSFVEWARNDHITLRAYTDYWGETPKLGTLIYRIVPEASVRVLQLTNNEIQIIADITTDDIPSLQDTPGVRLIQQPGLTVNGISMASDRPPFDDVRVRQAMNYAVNKEEMVQALYAGVGAVMDAPVPPTDWSYDASLEPYPYDVDRARQLLQEAGFQEGTQVTLMAYQNPRGYNPAGGRMAVAIQQYLGEVGVNVQIETLDFGAFLDKRRSFNWEGMAMAGWSGDNGDPDNFLYSLYSGPSIPINNSSRWSDPEVDNLLVQAREEPDQARRTELYQQAQRIIWEAAPWIWINYTTQTRAIRDNVQGFMLNPTQMFFGMEKVSLG